VAAIVRRFTERVVGGVLGEDPNALARVATEALERLPERDGVRICVPVGRGDALRGALGEPWAGAVVESASVHLGVVVQTDAVAVDASLSAVMDGLDAGVASWLGEAPWTSR
jgi:flagellar biosynthesis/type III secretory pathway protein FliH